MTGLIAFLLVIVAWQAHLLATRPQGASGSQSPEDASRPSSEVPIQKPARPARREDHPPGDSPTIPLAKAMNWRDVESDDYRTYITNLRAIGCPEQTLQDIVAADVRQAFAAKRREILASQVSSNFWEMPDRAALARQQRAVDEEFRGVLQQLLGPATIPPSGLADWKVSETEVRLEFLPEEKRLQALDMLMRFAPLDEQLKALSNARPPSKDPQELQAILADAGLRDAELGRLLSPEEYEKVEMAVSWTAENLRRAMVNFHPTEEEFQVIFRAWRAHDLKLVGVYATGQPDPGNAAVFERIRQHLGEERFQKYRQTWWR